MKNQPLLASLALAVALAGCTTQRAAPAPAAPPAPTPAAAPAPVTPAASASAASTGPALASSSLDEQKQKAASEAAAALLRARSVHFDFDVATLRSDDMALLDAHARYLGAHPGARVLLTGHTDERGTAEYNMALGEKRAKNARMYLLTHGAGEKQLDMVSYGEEKPLDRDHSEAAWAQNRRVELQYDKEAP